MSSSAAPDFSHLRAYEPTSAKVIDCPVDDLVGDVMLRVKHAGKSNKPYKNDLDRMNTKTGAIRRVMQGKETDATTRIALAEFRRLFAKHVIVGWRGVLNAAGQAVEFNEENCHAWLEALPDWIFQKVMQFCSEHANFLDLPDPVELEEQAGN